jgi:pimeloyl-ACP methyl ester carboxylesterase
MASVQIDGIPIEYEESGNGEPVVLVHGSASDIRTWHLQRDELAKRFRVIAYSRRHHWPNPRIPDDADYSMSEHADDLRALLAALDLAPAHLVGHSYGAFVCLLFAIQHPELIRTMVLAEPPVIPLFVGSPPRPWELLGLLLRRPRTALAILEFGARGLGPATAAARRGDMEEARRVFASAVLGPEGYARLSESRLDQIRANAMRQELLGSGLPPLRAAQVRAIDVPTLLITGERSRRLFHRLSDRLRELLPDVETAEIPGTSHMMHEENAPAFNAAVLSFLAGRGAEA